MTKAVKYDGARLVTSNYHETARTFSQKSSAPLNKLTLNEPAMTLQFLSNFSFYYILIVAFCLYILSHSRSV